MTPSSFMREQASYVRRIPRSWRGRGGFAFVLLALLVWSDVVVLAALPDTSTPALRLDRTIETTPFAGSTRSAKDLEGSAYATADGSLWLADDNGKAIYEVDPATGELKRAVRRTEFESAPRFGGGPVAGPDRVIDFESLAYDPTGDVLYVFSGVCCGSSLPTVFRLNRGGSGQLQVDSYQPLEATADFTAAAWNAADGTVWVAKGRDLRPYDYETNTAGAAVRIPTLRGILGISFSDDGADLFAVTTAETLVRADWAAKSVVDGWSFDLTPFGVLDSRAVELFGDQFYVADGYDRRGDGDPLTYAVFVFDVLSAPTPVIPEIASFSPVSGTRGTTVTISGTQFSGALSVTFNGKTTTSFSVLSDAVITAEVPRRAGTGPIAVSNDASTGESAEDFKYLLTRHRTSVTLDLVGHLRAVGDIRGVRRCLADRTVLVQRRHGGWQTVLTRTTRTDGSYRAPLPDRRGVYRTKLQRERLTDNICSGDVSPRARHRH